MTPIPSELTGETRSMLYPNTPGVSGLAGQQYPADSGDYAKMAAKHEAEREAERSGRIRAAALEAALRHVHPGSVTDEVLRVARVFEAYLAGTDTTASLS